MSQKPCWVATCLSIAAADTRAQMCPSVNSVCPIFVAIDQIYKWKKITKATTVSAQSVLHWLFSAVSLSRNRNPTNITLQCQDFFFFVAFSHVFLANPLLGRQLISLLFTYL